MRAPRALSCVVGPVLLYDELIHDEEPLLRALRGLYDSEIPCPAYLDDGFRAVRTEALARRKTERYRHLAELARRIEAEEKERATIQAAQAAP